MSQNQTTLPSISEAFGSYILGSCNGTCSQWSGSLTHDTNCPASVDHPMPDARHSNTSVRSSDPRLFVNTHYPSLDAMRTNRSRSDEAHAEQPRYSTPSSCVRLNSDPWSLGLATNHAPGENSTMAFNTSWPKTTGATDLAQYHLEPDFRSICYASDTSKTISSIFSTTPSTQDSGVEEPVSPGTQMFSPVTHPVAPGPEKPAERVESEDEIIEGQDKIKAWAHWKCSVPGCDLTTDRTNPRKAVSHFFGRNKICTKRIPKKAWIYTCRRHYQRMRYHQDRNDMWGLTQIALVSRQAECLEKHIGPVGYEIQYVPKLRRQLNVYNERLAAGEKNFQGVFNQAEITMLKLAKHLAEDLGPNKSVQDVETFVYKMHEAIVEGIIEDPLLVEFLPIRSSKFPDESWGQYLN